MCARDLHKALETRHLAFGSRLCTVRERDTSDICVTPCAASIIPAARVIGVNSQSLSWRTQLSKAAERIFLTGYIVSANNSRIRPSRCRKTALLLLTHASHGGGEPQGTRGIGDSRACCQSDSSVLESRDQVVVRACFFFSLDDLLHQLLYTLYTVLVSF